MKVEGLLASIDVDKKIFYYANSGNAGDSLINMGFFQLSERLGLKYTIIDKSLINQVSKDDIVIIAGGGSLVPEWSSTPAAINEIIKRTSNIIILPHSIREVNALMNNLPNECIIFCREQFSYDYCKSIRPDLSIYIDDDMAFKCDINKILNSDVSLNYLNVKNIFRFGVFEYHKLRSKLSKTIYAFRCDKEANLALKVRRIKVNDISSMARYGAGTYETSLYSSRKMLQLLDMYDVIYTDRLHVSIAGYLLGKEVHIYNNSYFKCLGVYNQSMSQSNNIKFHQ